MRFLSAGARRAHIDEELLSSYLDNQVTAAERARIGEHLRTCATCQAELSSLRHTVQLLRALPRVAVPRSFTLTEAQVGRAPMPAASAPWFGGLLRGAAALAGVALVLALGALLINRPGQAPPTQLARVAAPESSAVPTPALLLSPPAELSKATVSAAPTPTRQPAPAPVVPAVPAPTTRAGAPAEKASADGAQPSAPRTAAPTAPPTAAPRSLPAATASPPRSPATAAPAAAPAPPVAAPAQSAAPPTAPSAVASVPSLALAPPPTPATTPQKPALAGPAAGAPATASGRGPAAPAGTALGAPALGAPEAALLAAAIAAVFPQNAGLAYTDGQGLWAVDRQSGLRQIGQAPGASAPLISPDRAWIAYRAVAQAGSEIRVVRWDGGNAHTLVGDAALPEADPARPGAVRQLSGEMRWIPNTHRLAFVIAAQDTPAGQPAQISPELWEADADTGIYRHPFDLIPNAAFAYSPDGTRVAVLKRGGPGQGGSLAIMAADGTSARMVLDLPAAANGWASERQLAWLPDGSALWAAIPDKEAAGTAPGSGLSLYRILPASGNAEALGHIAAIDLAWSPDGMHLAYLVPVAGAPERRQLVLANADGSNGQPFETLSGTFQSWAPDGKHFLYVSENAWYVGAPGQPPRRLGATAALIDPRWLNAQQLIYPLIQTDSWVLALASLDGKSVDLGELPRALMFDATRR